MAELKMFSSTLEDGFALTTEDGNRLETVIIHLPGAEPTFTIGSYNIHNIEETYQELFSCPVDAA